MPEHESQAGHGRYIVRCDEASELADFLKDADSDPGITLLDVIGPRDRPHTAVVDMTHEKAQTLAQRFRDHHHLIIEPDRPLSLFAGGADARAGKE